jgi:hypothetical protein
MSLSEAKEFLQGLVDEIDQVQNIVNMKIVIKPAKESVKESYDEPFKVKSNNDIKQDFDNYFSTLAFGQVIEFPNTAIILKKVWDYEKKVQDYKSGEYLLVAKNIYYKNGTTRNVNEDVNNMTLPNETKPVDSLLVEVKYNRPESITKTTLMANHVRAVNSNGYVELKAINGNTIELLIVGINLDKDLVKIEALNTLGKPLRGSNSSWNSLPFAGATELLEKYKGLYESTIKNILSYKNSSEIKAHLLAEIDKYPAPQDQRPQTYGSYTFRGNIHAVNIYLKEGDKELTREVMLKNTNADYLRNQYFVAKDSLTGLYGLIDDNGQWFVKPFFHILENTGWGNLYIGTSPDSAKNKELYSLYNYKLNNETKTLNLAGFDVEKKINDSLLLVEREVNGPYGIYNLKTDKMVLPMKYVNVKIKGELLTCRVGEFTYSVDGKYGGYTIWGQEILPPAYESLRTDGQYFYTDSDTFNKNGKKCNGKAK